MKIAVSCENNQVFQHFGHTPEFAVFEAQDGKIMSEEKLSCEGSGHGALATLLANAGVEVLICGGIGGGAQMALADAGIRLFGGCSGSCDGAVEALLAGALDFNPDVKCSHHHDHGEGHSCGSHGDEHSCGSHGDGHSCGSHGCH